MPGVSNRGIRVMGIMGLPTSCSEMGVSGSHETPSVFRAVTTLFC